MANTINTKKPKEYNQNISQNISNKVILEASTPMMKQYLEIKAQVPDKLLFFRMGDFYELFGEDALIAAPIMGVALTSRDKKNDIPMCGVPYHSVSSYINKLTEKGYSVAICDQLEDPKKAKKIVKRGITRIITPGLVYDPEVLEESRMIYLASVIFKNGKFQYAVLDFNTGDFKVGTAYNKDELYQRLSFFNIEEFVYIPTDTNAVIDFILNYFSETTLTTLPVDFSLIKHYELNNILIDNDITENELLAAKLLYYYIETTQFNKDFPHIRSLHKDFDKNILVVDSFSRKHLDIDVLIEYLNNTITPMGKRYFILNFYKPSTNLELIKARHQGIELLLQSPDLLEYLKNELKQIGDIERLNSKVARTYYTPRTIENLFKGLDIVIDIINNLRQNFSVFFNIIKTLINLNSNFANNINAQFTKFNKPQWDNLQKFLKHWVSLFNTPLPANKNSANIFKKGVNPELDKLIDLTENIENVLKNIEHTEKQKLGTQYLKLGFNKVFGYYIEIPKGALKTITLPDYYIRKQTLTNAERFIIPELKSLEEQILQAQTQRIELEQNILEDLVKNYLSSYINISNELITLIKEIDFVYTLANNVILFNYTQPELHQGFDLIIKSGHHPILTMKLKEHFIPNDLNITKTEFIHIITGPNMSGKSTLMRMVALLTLMAHTGSYLPVEYAKIPITDRIFTRIGATDYILKGYSTFMVEMVETSNILKQATPRSLLIIDEIGRGTSTYDGIAIAWSVLEYIYKHLKSKCLFATHYHELVPLADFLEGVVNYSMEVREEHKLLFTRKYIKGPAHKSYGINVAKMAGLPNEVISRAYEILKALENKTKPKIIIKKEIKEATLFELKNDNLEKEVKAPVFAKVKEELDKINPDEISPREALELLYKLKEVSFEEGREEG